MDVLFYSNGMHSTKPIVFGWRTLSFITPSFLFNDKYYKVEIPKGKFIFFYLLVARCDLQHTSSFVISS